MCRYSIKFKISNMESRRSFLKKTGKSALFTSMVLASSSAYPISLIPKRKQTARDMVIGIIGAENSHTIGYGKMFNTDKKFPGMEVKYVWGETEEFAKRAMEKGTQHVEPFSKIFKVSIFLRLPLKRSYQFRI